MSQERSTETLTDERLIQLNQPQPGAWRWAADLGSELKHTPPLDDLALSALRDWALARDPESTRSLHQTLTPSQAHWMHYCDDVPLAFSRLVVETARRRSLRDSRTPAAHSHWARRHLNTPGLSSLDPEELLRLQGLAAAYHADDLTTLGQHGEAADAIFDAQTKLRGIQCAEERATLLQIDALRRRDESKGRPSMAQLEHAAELLRTTPVPGRWSELQLVRGRLFLYWKRADLAITPLGMALERLPSGLAHHLWVDTYLALAAAKISLLRFDEAARHLDEAAPFFTNEILHEDLQAQLHWMRGRIALRTLDSMEIAEHNLRQSAIIFRRLGRSEDLALAIQDLGEIYESRTLADQLFTELVHRGLAENKRIELKESEKRSTPDTEQPTETDVDTDQANKNELVN